MCLPRQIKIAQYSIAAKILVYIFSKPCINLDKLETPEWKLETETDYQYIE